MISNTSPIIFLAKIGKLELLKKLYKEVKITTDVKNEIIIENHSEIELIKNSIDEGTLIIKNPQKILDLRLGKGENSAIGLALELKEPLMIDDALATKAANSLGIETLRTTTLIFTAAKKKIITKQEAFKLINKLIEEGYYISPKYYKDILSKLK